MDYTLSLTSPAFEHNGMIPAKYTIDGENINPPLLIGGVSADAKSLALIVVDPDAATDPRGSGHTFDHWVVFNISPETLEIPENTVPVGAVVGQNSAGSSTYFGPAPPTGAHRYYFRLYELRETLDMDDRAGSMQVLAALHPLLISTCELVGMYQRPPRIDLV